MHGGGRFIESIHRSPFRSIRATWPFIVIYTIINDTDYRRERQKERERERFTPFRGKQLSLEDYTQACVPDEQGTGYELNVGQLKSFLRVV